MVRKDVSSIVKTRPWASTSRDSCHQNIDLAAWQKQYEYYRDALLSFQRRPSNSQLVAIFLEYGHNSFFAQNDYMIERTQESAIKSLIGSNKAIILMGARQVGKTSASTEYAQRYMTLSSY